MRPEAPKNGKRIFLERIGVLWKHLNFTQKSTVRNLVRYKKRFFMTVIGIGGCMGLILVGFGLQDSITAIAKNQFVSLFTYQANAVLNSDVDESEKEALQTDLENYSGIDELLEMYCQNIELQTDKKTVDAVLEVPKELTNFNDFYAFRDRKSGEVYEFPTDGGAAISEKTATMLGVKAGDTVQLKKGDDIVDVKISIIVENYVRHYLYLAPDLYEELFGGAPDYNQLLMKYQDTSSNYETALGEKIMTYDGVAAISFTSDLIDQIDNMLRSLDIVIVVLIVSAGLLAFVVLYNLKQHQHHRTTERAGNAESARLLRRRGGIVRVPGKHGADTVRRYRGHGNWNVFTSLRNSDRQGRYDDVRTKRVPAELRLERPDYPGVCPVRQLYDVLPVKKN